MKRSRGAFSNKPFKLTPPPKFVPKEYDEQCIVFEWAKYCRLGGIDLLYATLNGVRLPISLARKMKRAGNKAGPPDINLDCARGGFHGLRVEMKRRDGGVVSDAQTDWHNALRSEGYKVIVANGADEAIQAIKSYLDQDITPSQIRSVLS